MPEDLITSTRRIAPEETLARIHPYLADYDIHGVVDHTPPGLSLIRAVEILRSRPRSGYLNLGKGFGRDAALASGHMEAIEVSTIERSPEVPLIGADELPAETLIYSAGERETRSCGSIREGLAGRLLVRGADLLYGGEVYGYSDQLYLPSDDRTAAPQVPTNGLASGNSLAEAQLHAVYELIERHVSFVAAHRPRDVARAQLDAVPAPLASAIEEIEAAGMGVAFFALGALSGIHVFQCAVTEQSPDSGAPAPVHFGWAAHHSKAVAVARALSEGVQSLAIRRACRTGAIPSSRLSGGLLIAAEELSALKRGAFPGEQRLHARLCAAPAKLVGLDEPDGGKRMSTEEALARVRMLMILHQVSPLLCWQLSPEERPFSVVKCEIPAFRSLMA